MVTMKKFFASLALVSATSLCAEPYTEDWDSMAKHTAAPEWMHDAKLGIYFHWGVYTVPAHGSEWYPYFMGKPHSGVYKHHEKVYGGSLKHPYHKFVDGFTGEHFDPAEWAQLFQESGAKFAGPVAEHHDGFAMWDSDVTPWNAADRGPKRDILGELFGELRKRDMKTIATFHHARNLQRYEALPNPDTPGFKYKGERKHSHFDAYKGWATDSDDPELQLMYGNIPEDKWLEDVWYGKLKEVVDNYQPDIVWFDAWLDQIPQNYLKKFSAYYLNKGLEWDKEVVLIRKQNDLPLSLSINDHEKSREPKALPELWMTDDTISFGSWSYTEGLRIKPLPFVVHALIDTVAKNGVVLLNLSPKSDGTIPDNQRSVLKGLGDWLKVNGEGIYATRPWPVSYGEGPTKEPKGGFDDHKKFEKLIYTSQDIRYTQSKDGKTVYAIVLAPVEPGKTVTLKSLKGVKVKKVSVLGAEGLVFFQKTDQGLELKAPANTPQAVATTFALELAN